MLSRFSRSSFRQRTALPSGLVTAASVLAAIGSNTALSQDGQKVGSSSALLEEVVVTARKREEGSQDVPLQISAFGEQQLDALKIRDLTNLSVGLPNVALDDVGTQRGVANFSIRGLGINSSIPSIDPTVGVFVNGIYMGVNNGLIFDVFDLESVEVLRGPQGILFGRNVTGGAVLLNTKRPGEQLEGTIRAAVDGGGDGGINTYLMGTVGGPVTDTLGLKVTGYWNDDEGWHENQFDGSDVQAIDQKMVRGTAVWSPTDRLELTAIYEHIDIEGDGPVAQSHTNGFGVPGSPFNADPDSFDANYDEVGFQTNKTDFLTLQMDYGVDFGDGTVTALYGWRDNEGASQTDIDAQPLNLFHAPLNLTAEQNSFELRYNGQFGDANVTVGGYWFDNDLAYHERREILGALTEILSGGLLDSSLPFQQVDGGGLYDVETQAVFANIDYDLTDRLTLSIGARYSDEEKQVEVTTLALNTNVLDVGSTITEGTPVYGNALTGLDTRCNIVISNDCAFDFNDSDSWQTFAPKIGFAYALTEEAQLYGFWSRGFRSGGYNLRNGSPTSAPGPFDEEQVDSFEVGYKHQSSWGRLNAAVFYNTIDDMQREVITPDPTIGSVQITANTADTTIWGVEADAAISLSNNLLLMVSAGYIDASYDEVRFDLNTDGVIDDADKNLELPRAAELTYTIGVNYDFDIGDWGYASTRVSYAFRDESFFSDDNRGIIPEQDIVDAGIDFHSNEGNWVLSVYGRNLLDTVKWGSDAQLPTLIGPLPLGGTFSPLAKGRVYGAQVTFNF